MLGKVHIPTLLNYPPTLLRSVLHCQFSLDASHLRSNVINSIKILSVKYLLEPGPAFASHQIRCILLNPSTQRPFLHSTPQPLLLRSSLLSDRVERNYALGNVNDFRLVEMGVQEPFCLLDARGLRPSISEQILRRNVKRFREVLAFKAHILLHHSSLGERVMKRRRRWRPPLHSRLSPSPLARRWGIGGDF